MTREELISRWRTMRQAWEKLPGKDKNLRLAGVGFALIAIYAVLVYPIANERIGKLNYDLQKQAAREKNAAKAEAKVTAPPPSLGGKSPLEAENELRQLKSQLEETRQELAKLNMRFVPLDDSLALNVLKSGLTTLAEVGDMEVVAIEHVFADKDDKARAPSPQMLRDAAASNPFKRPLLELRARASFRGLMQFLDGLNQLPYAASPVACDIRVEIDRNPATGAPSRQWLNVQIKFAV